jgi:hypothetical protein
LEKVKYNSPRSYLSYTKFAYECLSTGKKKVKEEEEQLHNELRQLFIDKYRTGHFDSIQSVEKVIKECQILLKETEEPREKKRLEKLIKVTDEELLKLKNMTSHVLKTANRMQRQLDDTNERKCTQGSLETINKRADRLDTLPK